MAYDNDKINVTGFQSLFRLIQIQILKGIIITAYPKFGAWLPTLLVLIIITGCEDDSTTTVKYETIPPIFKGSVVKLQYTDFYSSYASLSIVSEDIPRVMINGIQIDPFRNSWFRSPFPVDYGDSLSLRIEFLHDNNLSALATANARLPGEFQITTPDPSTRYELPFGNDLAFNWTSAAYSDGYVISVLFDCSYRDANDSSRRFTLEMDTIATSLSQTVPNATLFPNTVEFARIIDNYGYVTICAFNGPMKPGDAGNVTGAAGGTFNGWTVAEFDFEIAGTRFSPRPPITPKQRLSKVLELQSKFIGLPN